MGPVPGSRTTRAVSPLAPLVALAAALLVAGCDARADDGAEPPTPSPSEASASDAALRIRVGVARAEVAELDLAAMATGQLHPFKQATVAAEAPGRVLDRSTERGDAVDKGARLFRIDTSKARLAFDQAVASEEASAIDLELADRELERGDMLLEGQDISRSSHDQLLHGSKSARQRQALAEISRKVAARSLADGRVRAPFEGTVVTVHAEVGDYVGPGTPLVTMVDLSRLRLRVGLTAAEARSLSQSGAAESMKVRFDSLGGRTVPATLHDISPLADPRSGTYTAELWVDQPEGAPLREGMVGRLDLAARDTGPRVVIPREAVTRADGGFAVWVIVEGEDGARVERRGITLGRHDRTRTEVLDGIVEGEQVVIDGLFALADGDAVEIDGAEG